MVETQAFNKFTAIYHKHFEVEIEYNEEFCVLHFARFDKLTPSVYKLCQSYIEKLSKFLRVMEFPSILIVVKKEDEKLNQFVQRFKFDIVAEHQGHNIHRRDL